MKNTRTNLILALALGLAAWQACAQDAVTQRCDASMSSWSQGFDASLQSAAAKLGVRRVLFEAQARKLLDLYAEYRANGISLDECNEVVAQGRKLSEDLNGVVAALNKPPATVDAAVSQQQIQRCDAALAAWVPRYTAALQPEKASGRLGRISLLKLAAPLNSIPSTYETYKADGLTVAECDQIVASTSNASNTLIAAVAAADKAAAPPPAAAAPAAPDRERQRCDAAFAKWSQDYTATLEAAKSAGKLKATSVAQVIQFRTAEQAVARIQGGYTNVQQGGLTTAECNTVIKDMDAASRNLAAIVGSR